MEPMLQRYQQVQENITLAAQSAGRTSDRVRLVVVTKSHPVEQISILAA